jgi:hypothetical protein
VCLRRVVRLPGPFFQLLLDQAVDDKDALLFASVWVALAAQLCLHLQHLVLACCVSVCSTLLSA